MVCGQATCDEAATNVVWWPGREVMATCLKHTIYAQHIAEAMGFSLRTQSLESYTAEVMENAKVGNAIAALRGMKE